MSEVINKVRALNLPKDKYTVYGGGILDAYGLRESKDVDLVVTPDLYWELEIAGWERDKSKHYDALKHENVEVTFDWNLRDYDFRRSAKYLLNNSIEIDGINFVKPSEVIKYKKALKRPKDIRDIELLEAYIKNSKTPK